MINNMGVFETIFRKPKADLKAEGYFKMLNGYTPVFSNAPESIYEMELTRAAIHSFASFASKLKPEISGTAQKNLERTLQFKPNPFMDTSKFIYRIATILSVNNTCFIVPIEDEFGGLIGYYPLLPQRCEVVEYNGAPFLRYTFGSGQKAAIEFERVGVMTQFQYTDDFFGESNAALRPTMQLIHTQNQGIINGVKNSASIRFLAKVANMQRPERERKEPTEFNVIVKAKDLVKHTFTITNSTERYPKKYRFTLVNRIQDKAVDIYECVLEANELDLRDAQEYRQRQKLQAKALTYCKELLFFIELSQEMGFISMSSCEYWSKLALEVKYMTTAWKKRDKTRA